MPLTGLTGRWLVSPDDEVTRSEARVVHPRFGARMERLAELRAAMTVNLYGPVMNGDREVVDMISRAVNDGVRAAWMAGN